MFILSILAGIWFCVKYNNKNKFIKKWLNNANKFLMMINDKFIKMAKNNLFRSKGKTKTTMKTSTTTNWLIDSDDNSFGNKVNSKKKTSQYNLSTTLSPTATITTPPMKSNKSFEETPATPTMTRSTLAKSPNNETGVIDNSVNGKTDFITTSIMEKKGGKVPSTSKIGTIGGIGSLSLSKIKNVSSNPLIGRNIKIQKTTSDNSNTSINSKLTFGDNRTINIISSRPTLSYPPPPLPSSSTIKTLADSETIKSFRGNGRSSIQSKFQANTPSSVTASVSVTSISKIKSNKKEIKESNLK